MRVLNYGVDIVVGTPGRVIDLLRRGVLNLSEIQFVILDEADQMLAVGFDEDVEVIMENMPQNRQSMLFSATMPTWIRKISNKYLKDPVVVDLVSNFILLFFKYAVFCNNICLDEKKNSDNHSRDLVVM